MECYRAKQKLQKLNKKGSKKDRSLFLGGYTSLSVLVSDVMTAAEYEEEKRRIQEEVDQLMERIENLNKEILEWRTKYDNLENEKEKLYQEMVDEAQKNSQKNKEEMTALVEENLEMEKYIKKIEGSEDLWARVKDMDSISTNKRHGE